ncbi:MAG TPA: hypothetical protein IAB45_03415 [Candidatus Onthousia faecavium]|nr:hypothetical protein [Candidatus Onthousia faecavium]
MSRTYKDRNKQWRVIRNSKIKKVLECYSDDIVVGKRKDRRLSRKLRKRLKRIDNKEIIGVKEYKNNWRGESRK